MNKSTPKDWLMAALIAAVLSTAYVLDDTSESPDTTAARKQAIAERRIQQDAVTFCLRSSGPSSRPAWTPDGDLVCKHSEKVATK